MLPRESAASPETGNTPNSLFVVSPPAIVSIVEICCRSVPDVAKTAKTEEVRSRKRNRVFTVTIMTLRASIFTGAHMEGLCRVPQPSGLRLRVLNLTDNRLQYA